MELQEEGITFGEHDGKPAVFKNGEVQKNTDLTLVDPKAFAAEHFKAKGWIMEDAPAATDKSRTTFDIKSPNGQPKQPFDHKTTYDALMEKHGGWTDKAQAEYTQAQLA